MSAIVCRLSVLMLAAASALALPSALIAADELEWSTDIEGSLREAAAAGKPVLLEFTAPWCAYCKRMEKTTFTDPAVVARISDQFVPVRVDADQHKDLVSELGIKGLPAILVVSPDLQIIERISGFQTAEALVPKLDKITAVRNPAATAAQRVASSRPPASNSHTVAPQRAELEFEPITHEAAAPGRRSNVRSISTLSGNPIAETETAESRVPQERQSSSTSKEMLKTRNGPKIVAAFGGTCLVSAVEDRELVPGLPSRQLDYRGRLLYFRTEGHKQQFLSQPAKYWPMLDGACAMTLLNDGERVEGQLQFAAVFRKRIWLFTTEEAMRDFLLDPSEVTAEIAGQSESAELR